MRRLIGGLTAIAVAWAPCSADWSLVPQAKAQQAAPAAPAPAQAPADAVFTRAELETLLKPIALFPDPLLAQLLPAAAYPLDIVQAARWLARNKAAVEKGDFSAADAMPWDASVKALLRFPDLINRLNDDLDWTSDLGDAFVHQPEDVATVIQDLRLLAEKGGALKSTPQQKVVRRTEGPREIVIIEPADPDIIYVPVYDPTVVFQPVGTTVAGTLLAFGTGIAVGAIINNATWNWGSGIVYPPVWPGYPGWRPPYPGWRPGVPPPAGWRPPGNINIGNEINIGSGNTIGSGNNLVGNNRPWRPDPDRYRPGQGSKPGLARPENRPAGGGVAGRPGAGDLSRPLQPGGGDGLGGAAIGGAVGGAVGGAIGSRPGAGIDRPSLPGGGAARPSGPRPETRPAERPQLTPGDRPQAGRPAERPQTRPTSRPETRPAAPAARPAAPAARPAGPAARPAGPAARPAPRPSGFDKVSAGHAAAAFGDRGAASRATINRPAGGGGAMARPSGGGGGAAMMNRGGGGGARMGGGGGARRR